MRVIKPNWVEHAAGEKKTKSPIYSLSVHPDGTRLATGGQDNKVKIWSTLPILDAEAAENDANHKLLCTMSAHTGPVLTVRWAHHGRFLASGSDDAVLLVWDLDPSGGGRVFGSEEVNVENWKALRRLVGHVADVVDCAWSRDDSMLASVGLDSKIIIWDGYTFERIKTIDSHQGFVKGVTWDPVGNYLATQSDDKTVRIWNTETWQEVQVISKPFELSPQSTFFRRLSWSPDGAFIAASNAMNGPVFVAAVIEREGWQSNISFVGHQNTIQVAAFNPRLFFQKGETPSRVNASCMLALGADDYNISIWRNTMHKPLVVIRDVFMRQLLDLDWANDGLTLYGCSADGTIATVKFEVGEFPELAEGDMTSKILDEYGYKSTRKRVAPSQPLSVSNSFAAPPAGGATEHVNVIIPRKSNKPKGRRINLSGTMTGGASTPNGTPRPAMGGRVPLARPMASPPRSGAHDAFARAIEEPLSFGSGSAATASMFAGIDDSRAGDKRKFGFEDGDRPAKGRTMGASRPIARIEEIRAPRVVLGGQVSGGGHVLPIPSVQSALRVQQADGSGILTAENSPDDHGRHSVSLSVNKQDVWTDFIPSPALAVVSTVSFSAVASEDGSVRIYSAAGRHSSTFKLPAPVSELAAAKDMLMVFTADCMVRVIDARRGSVALPPTSMSHLLDVTSSTGGSPSTVQVTSATVCANGCPVLLTSEPAGWAYDTSVGAWTQIASPWWAGSPLNETRTRGARTPPSGWVLAEIEAKFPTDPPQHRNKPKWWDEALSLGHYETRLNATRLLGSKDEYLHWLKQYAKYLGDENFRERAEELVADLMGPVYYLSGKPNWTPNVMAGLAKRDAAFAALQIMRQTTALSGFAAEQIGVLRKMQGSEQEWL